MTSRRDRYRKEGSFLQTVLARLDEICIELSHVRSCVEDPDFQRPPYPPPPAPPLIEPPEVCYNRDLLLDYRSKTAYCELGLNLPQTVHKNASLLSLPDRELTYPSYCNKSHIAWSPLGIVCLDESARIDKISTPSSSQFGLSGEWQPLDLESAPMFRFGDVTIATNQANTFESELAISTAVPSDDFDVDHAARSRIVGTDHYAVLINSISVEAFFDEFGNLLNNTWSGFEALLIEMSSDNFVHRPYESLMSDLRVLQPCHNSLPEFGGLLLNRGQLEKEFKGISKQLLEKYFGPFKLPIKISPRVHASNEFLRFHRLCLSFLEKYTPDGGNNLIDEDITIEFEKALQHSGLLGDSYTLAVQDIDVIVKEYAGKHMSMPILNSMFAVVFARRP